MPRFFVSLPLSLYDETRLERFHTASASPSLQTKSVDEITQRRSFQNKRSVELEFWIEPWGMVLPMQPGERFTLEVLSAHLGEIEIEVGDDANPQITVFLFAGSQVRVCSGDRELFSTVGGPEIPSTGGLSMRSFINRVFRKQDSTANTES